MKPSRIFRGIFRVSSVMSAFTGLSVGSASAAVLWDEGVQGDLSNEQAVPTGFTLSAGVNSVVGTAGTGDNQDFVTFNIPAGLQLTAITPVTFVSTDTTAFTGVQAGSSFIGSTLSAGSYLGYTHISTALLGANVLPAMGTGFGAQGFTPPLAAGSYTFLIQQLGAPTSYQLDYTLTAVPEASGQVAVALGLCGFAFVKWRRSR